MALVIQYNHGGYACYMNEMGGEVDHHMDDDNSCKYAKCIVIATTTMMITLTSMMIPVT